MCLSARRWSPYIGFVLGIALFAATLTASAAAQILLFLGTVAMIFFQAPNWRGAGRSIRVLSAVVLMLAGFAVTWWTIRPAEVQVFGFGIALEAGIAPTMDKTNTAGSLSHRVEMIEYGLKAGIQAFPLGTGAGSLRNLYPSLKEQRGVNVSDLHNYYVQQFMELGVLGLTLVVAIIIAAVVLSLRARNWVIFIPLFLMAGYLAFDVPGYYPALMIGFFGLAGAAAFSSTPLSPVAHKSMFRSARWVGLLALLIPVFWSNWLQPCEEVDCAIARKLGAREVVGRVFSETDGAERRELVDAAIKLNPQSDWAFELSVIHARESESPEAYLEAAAGTAVKFPVSRATVYTEWYKAAVANDNREMAEAAFRIGSAYYRPGLFVELVDDGAIPD